MDIFEAESAQQRAFLRGSEMYGASSPRDNGDIRNDINPQQMSQTIQNTQAAQQNTGGAAAFDPDYFLQKWEARKKR